jgi:hypothetical protein
VSRLCHQITPGSQRVGWWYELNDVEMWSWNASRDVY